MSGTLTTSRRLAGVVKFSINGTPWDVVGDLAWSISPVKRETLKGQSGVEGYSEMPMEQFISATLRDRGDVALETLITARNSEIQIQQANGKTISGYGMWCTELGEVRTQEASFAIRFEGDSVTETPV